MILALMMALSVVGCGSLGGAGGSEKDQLIQAVIEAAGIENKELDSGQKLVIKIVDAALSAAEEEGAKIETEYVDGLYCVYFEFTGLTADTAEAAFGTIDGASLTGSISGLETLAILSDDAGNIYYASYNGEDVNELLGAGTVGSGVSSNEDEDVVEDVVEDEDEADLEGMLEDMLGTVTEGEDLSALEGMLEDVLGSETEGEAETNAISAEGLLDIVDLVVADTDMYAITISDVEYDYYEKYRLNVLLENKSDITLDFKLIGSSINGIFVDVYMWETVSAGKKAYEELEITVNPESMGIYEDIGDYTDIALPFSIEDSEESEEIATESVHLYPQGEEKATVFERKPQPNDEVLGDNEYAAVTVVGYETNQYGDFMVKLFIVNKADEHLYFNVGDGTVNDFVIPAYLGVDLPAGMSGYGALVWDSYDLEENHIDAVEEVEFGLYAYNEDYEHRFETDIITLKP